MSDQGNFPLTLHVVLFVKSHVEAIPDHDPDEGLPVAPPENHLSVVKVPDEERQYSATMLCVVNSAKEKSSPYYIEMECMAVFETDGTLDEEKAIRGVTITGHNVLYGAIREAVSWLTSRQPYGPLLLGLSLLTPKRRKLDTPAK